MSKSEPILGIALRAVALAMAVAGVVLSYVKPGDLDTIAVPLLGIGLFVLALGSFLQTK
jgi:hypothetical protein